MLRIIFGIVLTFSINVYSKSVDQRVATAIQKCNQGDLKLLNISEFEDAPAIAAYSFLDSVHLVAEKKTRREIIDLALSLKRKASLPEDVSHPIRDPRFVAALISILEKETESEIRDFIAKLLRYRCEPQFLNQYASEINNLAHNKQDIQTLLLFSILPSTNPSVAVSLIPTASDESIYYTAIRSRLGDIAAKARLIRCASEVNSTLLAPDVYWYEKGGEAILLRWAMQSKHTRLKLDEFSDAFAYEASHEIRMIMAEGIRSKDIILQINSDVFLMGRAGFCGDILAQMMRFDQSFPKVTTFPITMSDLIAIRHWCTENMGVTYTD